LPDSTPNGITGTLDIVVTLSDEAAAEPQALVGVLSTWLRGLEMGLFGPARIRRHGDIEIHGRTVSARVECEDVPLSAVHVLTLMIQHCFRGQNWVEGVSVVCDGQPVTASGRMIIPPLPKSLPFTVEYPDDLKHYLRVEIEFRSALTPNQRDAVFDGFSAWDTVIDVVGEKRREGRWVEYKSRLLSPAIVEHNVHGYYGGLECLDLVVWLVLRIHRRLTVDRLTME
jgi:hypothetical protein